jgi:CRISPR/Cas system CSM-associated protein Csm2 small subunit
MSGISKFMTMTFSQPSESKIYAHFTKLGFTFTDFLIFNNSKHLLQIATHQMDKIVRQSNFKRFTSKTQAMRSLYHYISQNVPIQRKNSQINIINKTRNVRINVTLTRVRAIIVIVEKQ